MRVPLSLRRKVVERAENRREYCRLAQAGQEALFHMDHVVPETVGGTTILDNLALARVSCSLRKGAREFVVDPESGKSTPLFSPRRDIWQEHFLWNGVRLVGITAVGRGTVAGLSMNRPLALAIRREEAARGRHPPKP